MTQIISDGALFHHAHDSTGNGYNAFVKKAIQAQNDGSLAVLKSEVARVASDINFNLMQGDRIDKRISMAKYLAKQKLIVPIPNRYIESANTGVVNKWSVHDELKAWGFEPTMLKINIKKRRRFNTRECYVEITFKKK
ncbi:MAG: hypothetical protein H6797_00610 [Candidatus Nomurabacteria bacterium]|nr:MAG: hypothetical protein H6797_00610 [Candidatus Nomurabacteria bacterium]